MAVRLTTPVLGLAVGAEYTGVLESWLLNEGYATTAAAVPDAWVADSNGVPGAAAPSVTVTPTAATLIGSTNAATLTASGNIEFGTKDGIRTVVALLTGDLAADAATKIDTALTGLANASIVSSKLNVVSVETGTTAYVTVLSGNATILAELGLAVGQIVYGGDGRPVGASNLGAQADVPANDPTAKANREAPYFPTTPDRHVTIANDATHLTLAKLAAPGFDVDIAGVDAEAPSTLALDPVEGPAVGGTVVTIYGTNLEGVTGVTFDTVAGTDLDVSAAGDGVIKVTTPAGTAGPADVVVTDNIGTATLTGGFTYTA